MSSENSTRDLTVREAGRLGGEAVKAKYGIEHYSQRDGDAFSPDDLRLYRRNLARAIWTLRRLRRAYARHGDLCILEQLAEVSANAREFRRQVNEQTRLARAEAEHLARRERIAALHAAQMRMVA